MKFLTDTQTNQRLVEALRKLDWDVRTAYDEQLGGKIKDYLILRRANELDRVFLTLDELRGESGTEIARELRTNGGKTLQIMGGPGQDFYRAIGKLLFHYLDWTQFLEANDGIVIVSDLKQNCKCFTPEQYHQEYHSTDAKQFEQYLAGRAVAKLKPLKRRRHHDIPLEQPPMPSL